MKIVNRKTYIYLFDFIFSFIISLIMVSLGGGYKIEFLIDTGAILFLFSFVFLAYFLLRWLIYPYYYIKPNYYIRINSERIPLSEVKEIKLKVNNKATSDIIIVLKDGRSLVMNCVKNAENVLSKLSNIIFID
ncbi:MAG: hypothetical protein RRE78_08145 [Acidianus sp.]|jgi:hypothetical protein|nr:hypothetical protein [Acidianus sp.]